jgi:hypothetical protein
MDKITSLFFRFVPQRFIPKALIRRSSDAAVAEHLASKPAEDRPFYRAILGQTGMPAAYYDVREDGITAEKLAS